MPQDQQWTVGRLLEWTTDYLKKRGSETSRLDAELLLAEALGCQRIDLYATFGETPAEPARTAFRDLVRRRGEGAPVAYLLGRREFYSLSFRVTPDVLIPRPETEHLVITLLDLAKQQDSGGPATVCDVGTGSGIIAVCAAKYLPTCQVTAVDKSSAALEVAEQNAAQHSVRDQIEFLPSDLLAAVPEEQRFDFIVSNPPYVSEGEFRQLAADVRDYEPRGALVAGPQGTEVIERLIPQAAEHLHCGRHLLIEISPMIHKQVLALLASDGRFQPGQTILDLARLPRVIHAVRQ